MHVIMMRRSRVALSLLSGARARPTTLSQASHCCGPVLQLRGLALAAATPPLLDGSGGNTYTLVVPELGDSVS